MEDSNNKPPSTDSGNANVETLLDQLSAVQLKDGKAGNDESSATGLAPDLNNAVSTSIKAAAPKHAFWNTQPVSKFTEEVKSDDIGPIDSNTDVERIRKHPYTLPDAFEWIDIDVDNDDDMSQLYTLLTENYVEDYENLFRFDYKPDFLQWAMTPPDYKKDWHVGVCVKSSKRLVGFISGIPVTVRVCGSVLKAAEINFLCVHKQLRSKRLAPVLIKEVTRRVNLCGIWQAVYTAGVVIPKPVATCRYWHRPLNIKTLVQSRFFSIGSRMTVSMAQRLYKLPPDTGDVNMRLMEPRDVDGVRRLIESHLESCKIHPVYTDEEIRHIFLPRDGIIYTYVITSEAGTVTDLFSFYCLGSSVIGNSKIGRINAAYLYYNIATTITFKKLMERGLQFALDAQCDVFNALDMMNNQEVFKDLKFGEGDGSLHYYLYNWRLPQLKPSDIGIVMP